MLSGVLRSETAVTVNVAIMRAFVGLRRAATSYTAIERRLTDLERETVERLGKHDEQLLEIFKALRQLISPPPRPKRRVGFGPREEKQQPLRAAIRRWSSRIAQARLLVLPTPVADARAYAERASRTRAWCC
jgi:hypothetical protein